MAQRMWRRARSNGCREHLTSIGVLFLVSCTAFPASVWIHVTFPQAEAPGAIIAGILALAAFVVYIRSRRFEWLWGAASAELLGLGMGLAVFHGWEQQVVIAFGLACVLYLIAVIKYGGRLHHRVMRALYPGDEQLAAAAHLTHTGAINWAAVEPELSLDPHTIVIYPDKRKAVAMLVCQLAMTSGCAVGAALLLLSSSALENMLGALGLILFAAAIVLFGLPASVSRLANSHPAFCVYRDGIIDNVSLGTSGIGFIPWDQIGGAFVISLGLSVGIFSQRYLAVIVTHPSAIIARQAAWKRGLLRLMMQRTLSPVNIPEAALPFKADALESEMRKYFEQHIAPRDQPEEANDATGLAEHT